MVQLLSVIILKQKQPKAVVLHATYELAQFGFFQRGSIQEVCLFVSRETANRSKPGQAQTVEHAGYNCHCRVLASGLVVTAVTDLDYPPFAALSFLQKVTEKFNGAVAESQWSKCVTDTQFDVQPVVDTFKEFQDPAKADKITAIKKDLEETTEIVKKTVDQLLERGERLEDLIDRSDDLSMQTQMFAKKAEDMNSCCTLF